MKTLKTILISSFLISSTIGKAQFQGRVYEEDSSIVVTQGGIQKSLAWCGGFNNPQFSSADLNHDGLNDLVVYQPDQFSIKTFINYGVAGSPDYRYRPQYSNNFPFCTNYLILKDYNGDGVSDLFQSGGIGFTLYRGYYNASSELCFTYYKSLFYNNDTKLIGDINAEVNPGDIPAIVDLDNDGDLDFLAYYGDGYFMSWYQNMQVEKGLPKDSVVIRLADRCWGKMIQSYLRTHTLGISCDNSSLSKTTGYETAKITDGGNTPCLIDMDGDNDYDLLDGHRAFNNIVYLKNGKFPSGIRDSMIAQDTAWVSMGDTVKIAQWAAGFHLDLDIDGKRDLLISPNAPFASENYKCSQYYKNLGTDKIPSFKLQTDTFLVSDAIDLGSNSYPFFYDYNKDGKPDLFVGSKGYYEANTGLYISKIMYLQNTSTIGNPSFQLITNDFLGLSSMRYKGISIAIGDIDNDGKDDLLLGHLSGSIDWIKNTASSGTVSPLWLGSPIALKDASGVAIATNGSSVPMVYDMNADGVNDLLSGDQVGYLFYYQNNSTIPGTTSLIYTNNQLGFIKSDPEKTATGFSTPIIAKMDNSGKEYLMMGSRSGRIFRFTGFQGGNVFSAYKQLDSAYSYILSDHANSTSYMSAPAIADIDNDGKYEMIVGNVYGGLLLYKQTKIVNIAEEHLNEPTLICFPNPAKNEIYIGINQTLFENNTSVLLYNSMGQLVQSNQFAHPQGFLSLNISNLPNAVYYAIIQSQNKRFSTIFVKQN